MAQWRGPARAPGSLGGPRRSERHARGTHRGAGPERARVLHLRGAAQRQRPEAECHHAATQNQLQQPERQQRASRQQRRAWGRSGGGGPAGGEPGRRRQYRGGRGGAPRPHWGLQRRPGPAGPQRGQRRLLGSSGRGARAPGLGPAREPGHRAAGAREHHGQGHGRAGKGAAGGGREGTRSGVAGATHWAPRAGSEAKGEGRKCARPNHLLLSPLPPAAPTCHRAGPPPACPERTLTLTHTHPRAPCARAAGLLQPLGHSRTRARFLASRKGAQPQFFK